MVVDCNFKTDGWREEMGHEYCTITSTHVKDEFPGHFTCNEENCIHQQQLKLLKEIKQAMWPIYQKLLEK